jgi:hypothetical protein
MVILFLAVHPPVASGLLLVLVILDWKRGRHFWFGSEKW